MPATCQPTMGSSSTIAAPTVESTGTESVRMEASVSAMWAWAQFIRRCPVPGITAMARMPIHWLVLGRPTEPVNARAKPVAIGVPTSRTTV